MHKDFVVYYGYGKQEKLSGSDLIIVEPKAQSAEDLLILKRHKAEVFAYISFVEVIPEQLKETAFSEKDYLTGTNGRLKSQQYNNFLMDLRSTAWQSYLLSEIDDLVNVMGYDGLFVDTIADIENGILTQLYGDDLHHAYATLVKMILKNHPNCKIIQNNGLNTVIDFVGDDLYGLCWENPPFNRLESLLWVKVMVKKLKTYCNLKVLLLEEEQYANPKTEKFARRMKWFYCKSPNQYL